jgi:hypothetical protein
MSENLADALQRLARILQAENDALLASDIPRATALAGEKREAVEQFIAARAKAQTGALRSAGAEIRSLAAQLPELAEQNRQLLARAMAVQTRIIGMIAGVAAQTEQAKGLRYTGCGATRRTSSVRPVALSARA